MLGVANLSQRIRSWPGLGAGDGGTDWARPSLQLCGLLPGKSPSPSDLLFSSTGLGRLCACQETTQQRAEPPAPAQVRPWESWALSPAARLPGARWASDGCPEPAARICALPFPPENAKGRMCG